MPSARGRLDIGSRFLCGARLRRASLPGMEASDSQLIAARFDDVTTAGVVCDNADLAGTRVRDADPFRGCGARNDG